MRHVGNGSEFGLTVEYSCDGTTPLGTAGALRLARPLLGEWFAVLDGDSYLPVDFHGPIQQFLRAGTTGVMTVYRNDGQYGRSNVAVENGYVTRYDRSGEGLHHIHYGFSVLRAAVLESVPVDAFCSMDTVYQRLVAAGQLGACMVAERFYEIGTPDGLGAFEEFVKANMQRSDSMELIKECGGSV
jgi:NDP-sugar pyrophosphorylase family protein